MKYIKDEDFSKMTKKQKDSIESEQFNFSQIEVDRIVMIPTRRKMDAGYVLADIFAHNKNGWFKATTYDCWKVTVDTQNTPNFNYQILKGDFENGGVQIFGFGEENHTAFIDYGGEIIIRNK